MFILPVSHFISHLVIKPDTSNLLLRALEKNARHKKVCIALPIDIYQLLAS